jgi:16S rRNA (uracil1498-N3)-methyltransferase
LTTPRLFVPVTLRGRRHLELDNGQRHYLQSVLRLREGGKVALFDGSGWDFEACLLNFKTDGATVEILSAHPRPVSPLRIVLAQALAKSDRMDFIIQKTTELDVAGIVPFRAQRSVSRISPERAAVKQARWQSIAREAAEQSGRGDIPEILAPVPFDKMLRLAGDGAARLIFWEGETQRGIRQVLHEEAARRRQEFFVVVGPEGGLAWEEIEAATASGFVAVSLGRQVLRVETAALAVVSVLQYELGTLGGIPGQDQPRD